MVIAAPMSAMAQTDSTWLGGLDAEWLGASFNWDDGSGGVTYTPPNGASDIARFTEVGSGGSNPTVDMNGQAITVLDMYVSGAADGYDITDVAGGGLLTIGTLTHSATGTNTISGAINATTINVSGGALTLTNAGNTSAGTVAVGAGARLEAYAGSLGTSAVSLNGGVLNVSRLGGGSAPSNLIHRYSFDETSGTTFADSVGSADLTLIDLGGSGQVNGQGGHTLAQDNGNGAEIRLWGGGKGNSDYVKLPNGTISSLGDATFEMWATQHAVQNWSRILSFGSAAASDVLLMAWTQGTNFNSDRVELFLDGDHKNVDNTMQPYTLGQEFHITMTVDEEATGVGTDTIIKWYKDGVYAGEFSTPKKLSQSADTESVLGRSKWNDNTANASWNEFRIYDEALDATAVANSFAAGLDVGGPNEDGNLDMSANDIAVTVDSTLEVIVDPASSSSFGALSISDAATLNIDAGGTGTSFTGLAPVAAAAGVGITSNVDVTIGGPLSLGAGSAFAFTGETLNVSGTTLAGSGTITVNSTLNGGALTLAGGTFTAAGAGDQNYDSITAPAGAQTIDITGGGTITTGVYNDGGLTQALSITGDGTLAIAGAVDADTTTFTIGGAATLRAPSLADPMGVAGTAIILNGGTFESSGVPTPALGAIDLSSTGVTVTDNSNIVANSTLTATFDSLALNSGIVNVSGAAGGTIFSGNTTAAAGAASGVTSTDALTLGTLTVGEAADVTIGGPAAATSLTILTDGDTDTSAIIRANGVFDAGTYDDGANTVSLTQAGTGTMELTGLGATAADGTTFKVQNGGTIVFDGATPLGGSTAALKLDGGAVSVSLAGVKTVGFSPTVMSGGVAYWDFNEAPGAAIAVDSISGADGTLENMGAGGFVTDGVFGNAINFVEQDDNRINVANGILPNLSEATVSVWIKETDVNEGSIFHTKQWAAGDLHYFIHGGGNTLRAAVHSAGPTDTDMIGAMFNDVWTHIVLTYDANNELKFYRDGVLNRTQPLTGNEALQLSKGLFMGANQNGNARELKGVMDEMVILDRVLDISEIGQLYAGMEVPALAGDLDLTATAVDVSANSTLETIATGGASFGALTFTAPAVLTTTGATGIVDFAGTTLIHGTNGFETLSNTDPGPLTVLAAEYAVLVKTGDADLVLDSSDPTIGPLGTLAFDVQAGRLIAQAGSNPLGDDSAVAINGGEVVLVAKDAATDPTFDNPVTSTVNGGTLTAGRDGDGFARTVTIGSPTNHVTLDAGGTLLVRTLDGYTLNVGGNVAGAGDVTIGAASTVTVAGMLGAGTVTIDGSLTVAGAVNVNELIANDGGSYAGPSDLTVANTLTLNGDLDLSASALVVDNANVTVNGGTLTLQTGNNLGGGTPVASVDLSNGGGLVLDPDGPGGTPSNTLRTRGLMTTGGTFNMADPGDSFIATGNVTATPNPGSGPERIELNGGTMSVGGITAALSGPAGALSHWAFDNAADVGYNSITTNSLTANGEAQHNASGKFGGALQLDGNGDFLSGLPALPALGNSPYSIAVWIKTGVVHSGGMVGWGNYGAGPQVNAFRLDGDNGLRNYWWGNDIVGNSSPIDLEDSQWHHVMVTYNGTNEQQLFVDGNQIAIRDPSDHNVTTWDNFRIGSTFGTEFFNGMLDEMYIYDRALTPAERDEILAAGEVIANPLYLPDTDILMTSATTIDLVDDAELGDLTVVTDGSPVTLTFTGDSELRLTLASTTLSNAVTGTPGIIVDSESPKVNLGELDLAGSTGPFVQKIGAGELIITDDASAGAANYTGTAVFGVDAGTLTLGDTGLLGASILNVNGATLKLSSLAPATTYTETPTFAGDVTVLAGAADSDAAATAVVTLPTINPLAGQTLTLGAEADYTLKITNTVTAATVATTGVGAVTLDAGGTATTAVDVSTGTLNIGPTATIATPSISVTETGSLNLGALQSTDNLLVNTSGTVGVTNELTVTNKITLGEIELTDSVPLKIIGGNLADPTGTVTASGSSFTISGPSGSMPSGMVLWLDANDIQGDGTPTVDSAAVTTWTDKSGAGNHATNGGDPTATVFADGTIGNMPAVRFDGNDWFVSPVDVNGSARPDLTVFSVHHLREAGGVQALWGHDNGGWDRFALLTHTGVASGISNGGGTFAVPEIGDPGEGFIVLSTELDRGVANGSTVLVNGGVPSGGANFTEGGNPGLNTLGIGAIAPNGTLGAKVDLAEFLIFERLLDPDEEQDVGGYLAAKYGISSSYTGSMGGGPISMPNLNVDLAMGGPAATINLNGSTITLGNLATGAVTDLTIAGTETASFNNVTLNPAATTIGSATMIDTTIRGTLATAGGGDLTDDLSVNGDLTVENMNAVGAVVTAKNFTATGSVNFDGGSGLVLTASTLSVPGGTTTFQSGSTTTGVTAIDVAAGAALNVATSGVSTETLNVPEAAVLNATAPVGVTDSAVLGELELDVVGGTFSVTGADAARTDVARTLTLNGGTLTTNNVGASTPEGLVHRYSFNETGGSGTVLVDSIGGANGSIVEVGANNADVGETHAGKFYMTGGDKAASDYATLPDGLYAGQNNLTVETWATQESVNYWSRIFSFGPDTAANLIMTWTRGSNLGQTRMAFKLGNSEHSSDLNTAYNLGQEYHIVMTLEDDWNGSGETQLKAYRDGVHVQTLNTAYNLADLPDVNNWLGRAKYNDGAANAIWDEFRTYNTVLTPEQIIESRDLGPDGLAGSGIDMSNTTFATAAGSGNSTLALTSEAGVPVTLSGLTTAAGTTLVLDSPAETIGLTNLTMNGASMIRSTYAAATGPVMVTADAVDLSGGMNYLGDGTQLGGDGDTNATNLTLADNATIDWMFDGVGGNTSYLDVKGVITLGATLNVNVLDGVGTAATEDIYIMVGRGGIDDTLLTSLNVPKPAGWDWTDVVIEFVGPGIEALVLKDAVFGVQTQNPGDTNADDVVDAIDMDNFQLVFGLTGQDLLDASELLAIDPFDADFDDDGDADLDDFVILRETFGDTYSTAPAVPDLSQTPEPATMSLLALGALAILRRRRRK